MRFSKGRVCCHCNGTDVVRNGIQRYLCRNCKKSFKEVVLTKNLIVHSNIAHCYTMIKDFKNREPIFI